MWADVCTLTIRKPNYHETRETTLFARCVKPITTASIVAEEYRSCVIQFKNVSHFRPHKLLQNTIPTSNFSDCILNSLFFYTTIRVFVSVLYKNYIGKFTKSDSHSLLVFYYSLPAVVILYSSKKMRLGCRRVSIYNSLAC